jgi:hypothetical protein
LDPLTVTTTIAPKDAQIRVHTGAKKLTEDEWFEVATDVYSSIVAARGARDNLEENLKAWLSLYELEVQETDYPWDGAANLVVPIIPTELDAMRSYIVSTVFVPRLIMVHGMDDDAAKGSALVERYKNYQLTELRRDGQCWYETLAMTIVHLALRDGTAVAYTPWNQRIEAKNLVSFSPKLDEEGDPVIDDDGEVVKERIITQTKERINEASIIPVQLKDISLVPAESRSPDSAVAVNLTLWMYEEDMRALVAEETFDKEKVEEILMYGESGTSDVAGDPQGSEDKDIGGQIDVGQAQGSQTSRFFKNRGPFKIIQQHSRQRDMNEDGIVEENVFWIHEKSQIMAGWMPWEYMAHGRPFHTYSPLPRPDRFEGYSLIERLCDLVGEINSIHNQRRNEIDLRLSPPLLEQEGESLRNKNNAWGPGIKYKVSDIDKSYKQLQLASLPPDSWQEEQLDNVYVSKITGQDASAVGAQSSGRRTATEKRQQQAAQSTRANTMAQLFRFFLRKLFTYIHQLELQYLEDDPKFVRGKSRFTIPREVLAQNYRIDIAGASDPVDAASRRQEVMAMVGIISKFPDIAQSAKRRYALLRLILEAFQRPDIESLIGTEQEAAQAEQQEAAQRAAQAQQQQALAAARSASGKPRASNRPAAPAPQGSPA